MFIKRSIYLILLLSITILLYGCKSNTSTKATSNTLSTTELETTTSTTEETTTVTTEEEEDMMDTFKVLAIGNSFSSDAVEYLYQIAENKGFEEIVIGNLYIAGCSLATHWNNANNNNAHYTYYKNTNNTWESYNNTSILQALAEEEWDFITVQQVSSYSGLVDSYDPYLTNLINYVNTHKTNADAKIAWHMTWAYQSDSTHHEFPKYNSNQMTMYNRIVSAVQTRIVTDEKIDIIIPSGTAIQNARTSYIGDTLTRDGYHLDLKIGRLIAGLTWFKALTGETVEDINYIPTGMEPELLAVAKEAVDTAVENPFEITESSFAPEDINLDDYTELDLEYVLGYWNSLDSGYSNTIVDFNTIAKQFITHTTILSKEDLPNGTVIMVDEGYKFRINYWKSENSLPALNQRSQLLAYQMVIDDAWWLGNEYVAFNLTTSNGLDLTNLIDETSLHFRIYIPNNSN